MSSNENASLKKQLLESKSTIAELQGENRALEQKLVDLEAALISKDQTISSLASAHKTFEASLFAEKERLLAEFDLKAAEDSKRQIALENQVCELKYELEILRNQCEAYRLSLEDFEKRFCDLFAQKGKNNAGDPNIQEIFNYEIREKQKLGDKIFDLSKKLNEAEKTKNALELENRKYREQFGIPENFGHADEARRNQITRIGFLEREIEQLEEERAELKCRLRQMAAFVSPNAFEGDVFSQLDREQREALCLFAVNLLSGKKEVMAEGRISQELVKRSEKLVAENEALKRDCERKHREMMELVRNFRFLASGVNSGNSRELGNRNYQQSASNFPVNSTQYGQNFLNNEWRGFRQNNDGFLFSQQSPNVNFGVQMSDFGIVNLNTNSQKINAEPNFYINGTPSILKNHVSNSLVNTQNENNFYGTQGNAFNKNIPGSEFIDQNLRKQQFNVDELRLQNSQQNPLAYYANLENKESGPHSRIQLDNENFKQSNNLANKTNQTSPNKNLNPPNSIFNEFAQIHSQREPNNNNIPGIVNFSGAFLPQTHSGHFHPRTNNSNDFSNKFNEGTYMRNQIPNVPEYYSNIDKNSIKNCQNLSHINNNNNGQQDFSNKGQTLAQQNQFFGISDQPLMDHPFQNVNFQDQFSSCNDFHKIMNQQNNMEYAYIDKRIFLLELIKLREKLKSENLSAFESEAYPEAKQKKANNNFSQKAEIDLIGKYSQFAIDDQVLFFEFQKVKEALADQIQLYSAELNHKTLTINTMDSQISQLKRFLEGPKKSKFSEEQISLVKRNDDLTREALKLNRESEIYRTKISLLSKRIQDLEEEVQRQNSEAQKFNNFDKNYANRLNNLISNLFVKLEQSVPLSEFRDLAFKAENFKQDLANFQTEVIHFTEMQTSFKFLKKDFMILVKQLAAKMRENLNLVCELKLIEAKLCDVDDSYFHFKNLFKAMMEGLKERDLSPENFLAKFMDETISEKLTPQNLSAIFSHFGVKLFENDHKILREFLLADEEGSVFKEDFLRKVSLFAMDFRHFEGENEKMATAAEFHKFDELIENCGLNSEELFKLFDYKGLELLNLEDVTHGFKKLGLGEKETLGLKETFQKVFFAYEQKIGVRDFTKYLQAYRQGNWKRNMLMTKDSSWEIELGQMLNDFLTANKQRFADSGELFNFIDQDSKGFLNASDFEFFFKSQVGFEINNRKIEDLFNAIERENFFSGVSQQEFASFLKKCQTLTRISNKISSANTNHKILNPNPSQNKSEFARQGLDLKLSLLKGELGTSQFKLKQLNALLSQSGEQLAMFERKDADGLRLISMYRAEIAKLSDEIHQLRAPRPPEKSNPEPKSEKSGDWWNLKENSSLAEMQNSLSAAQQQVQILKLENGRLLQKVRRTENEALGIFMSTARAAAEKDVDLCQVLQHAFHQSQELLSQERLKENRLTISRLEAQIQDLELQSIEDQVRAQKSVEGLCERVAALRQTICNFEQRGAPLIDAEHISKMAIKIKELSAKIIQAEENFQESSQRNKELEIAVMKNRICRETLAAMEKIPKICGESQLLQKVNESILELRNLKIEKMKLDKELSHELNNQRGLRTALAASSEEIARLEGELQRQIDSSAQRELFWSEKYQRLLKTNSELKILEAGPTNKRKILKDEKSGANKNESETFQNLLRNNHIDPEIYHETQELQALRKELTRVSSENEILRKFAGKQSASIEESSPKNHVSPKQRDADQNHSNLLSTAQTAVSVLQGLLDAKQADLLESQNQVKFLKDQLYSLQEQFNLLQVQLENRETSQNENFFHGPDSNGFKGQNNFGKKQTTSSLKMKREERELELMRGKEKALNQEISQLKLINRELVEKLKAGLSLNQNISFHQTGANFHNENKESQFLAQISELQEKLRQNEEILSRKNKELSALFETVKQLKNDLVEQSKMAVAEKMTTEQRKVETEKARFEFEGKLKISAKRIKELTQKLKEVNEEISLIKERDFKREENLKRVNKENVDLNLTLLKKHEEIGSLKVKLEKKEICQICENRDSEMKAKQKENEIFARTKNGKSNLKKAISDIVKEEKTAPNENFKPLLPVLNELRADFKKT